MDILHAFLAFIAVLACPLMMILMMKGMHGAHGEHSTHNGCHRQTLNSKEDHNDGPAKNTDTEGKFPLDTGERHVHRM